MPTRKSLNCCLSAAAVAVAAATGVAAAVAVEAVAAVVAPAVAVAADAVASLSVDAAAAAVAVAAAAESRGGAFTALAARLAPDAASRGAVVGTADNRHHIHDQQFGTAAAHFGLRPL
jgi:hypothetical protein